jgi:hypothetical protein
VSGSLLNYLPDYIILIIGWYTNRKGEEVKEWKKERGNKIKREKGRGKRKNGDINLNS